MKICKQGHPKQAGGLMRRGMSAGSGRPGALLGDGLQLWDQTLTLEMCEIRHRHGDSHHNYRREESVESLETFEAFLWQSGSVMMS